MRGVLAFDPGQSGAVAIVNDDVEIVQAFETLDGVLDLAWLRGWITGHEGLFDQCVIESVHAMPKQGVVSVWSFARGVGQIEGLLAGLQLPYYYVTPQAWQKGVGITKAPPGATTSQKKARNIAAAKRLYPKKDLRASERSKVPHLGIVDALLIGHHWFHFK